MTTTMEPPDAAPAVRNNPDHEDLRAKAEEWIRENPAAYDLFVRFAKEAVARNRRFGISLITERVRWEARMTWRPDRRGFKMNNNHRAYVARKLIEDVPGVRELIELRRTVW